MTAPDPDASPASAYQSEEYALSLSEFGTPRLLPRCGGWLLCRPIPNTPWHDAMGCYPLFSCLDWRMLGADLADLPQDIVSVGIVADPFGNHDVQLLSRCFDRVVPFKDHYVTDLRQPIERVISRRHQINVRKSQARLTIARIETPQFALDEWTALFETLIKRHHLKGIHALSPRAFKHQLSLPGLVMFRAAAGEQTVSAHLWFVSRTVAYSHLVASNSQGYKHMASFGLHWHALKWFAARGIEWADLGGGAGVGRGNNTADGLTAFKSGWATGTRMAYFCQRVINPQLYESIVKSKAIGETDYFPAYRRGEF